jgi:hypothetical protein
MRYFIALTFAFAWAKATRGSPNHTLYSAQLEIHETTSPREIGPKVAADPRVQACLRAAILKSGDDFSVSISGEVTDAGKINDAQVIHPYQSLKDCLTKAFTHVKLGEGASGPFTLEFARVRVTPPSFKTFLLDLNEPKKYQ